jgi:hypothetical protein
MDDVRLIVFPILFALFFVLEWRRMRARSRRNPELEEEMKATRWRDRRRIAAAVRRGQRLDNPRDARLAVAMAEEQRDMHDSPWLRGTRRARLLLGAALLVLGLLATALPVAALGLVLVGIGAIESITQGRLDERLREAERLNREQAALEAPPAGQ